MSATPIELLANSRIIRGSTTDEAGHRATVSRAYYAAYHAALSFHCELPLPGSVGNAMGAHEQLAAQLINPTIPATNPGHQTSRRLGIMLRDLLRDRVVADYRLNETVSSSDADQAILKGQKILTLCP